MGIDFLKLPETRALLAAAVQLLLRLAHEGDHAPAQPAVASRAERARLRDPAEPVADNGLDHDEWEMAVRLYVDSDDSHGHVRNVVTLEAVLVEALGIHPDRITISALTRVGNILARRLRWKRVERRLQKPRYVYERPKKSAHDTTGRVRSQGAS